MPLKTQYYIGELAEYFGVSTDTLRLYDRAGILSPKKEKNGYRAYSREDMIFLSYVLRLRQFSIPLQEIKHLVNEGSLENAEQMLESREAVLTREIERLRELREVCEDYRAMFRATRENLGRFSVCQSPRIILREVSGSLIDAASAFDRLDTHLVRRFTSLIDGSGLYSPIYAEILYDPMQRKSAQRFAVCIVDRENTVDIPADSRTLFTDMPPQKAVFSAAKCRVDEDYDHFVKLHQYITTGKFTVTGDMVVVFVSLRNGKNQSEDYYLIWVPVA